ncbi:MAG: hypothetical protein A2428_07320 [Bdellovibrionales bacterium RIFOXYC1_FULL_54_43]|nr:MAG: hypothetical protein A2428_07320 [Bdellovibrionales bacterium RIFOXYC1_FULL_54_43]OFZ85844.1 MAG: hypothetical protein A2603_13690 [Bdellovibrionales bacterium RIFOXYD1_FULL_55_31]
MTQARRILASVCAAVILAACGKEAPIGRAPTNREENTPVSLEENSVTEVLRIKYNRAQLTCNLKFSRGQKADFGEQPSEVFSEIVQDAAYWDLLNDYSDEKAFELKGAVRDSWIKVKIKIKRIEVVHSLTYMDDQGKVYRMRYSPILRAEYFFEENYVFIPEDGNMTGKGNGFKDFTEGSTGNWIDMVASTDPTVSGDFYSAQLNCDFDTELKPEYKDQFVVQPTD